MGNLCRSAKEGLIAAVSLDLALEVGVTGTDTGIGRVDGMGGSRAPSEARRMRTALDMTIWRRFVGLALEDIFSARMRYDCGLFPGDVEVAVVAILEGGEGGGWRRDADGRGTRGDGLRTKANVALHLVDPELKEKSHLRRCVRALGSSSLPKELTEALASGGEVGDRLPKSPSDLRSGRSGSVRAAAAAATAAVLSSEEHVTRVLSISEVTVSWAQTGEAFAEDVGQLGVWRGWARNDPMSIIKGREGAGIRKIGPFRNPGPAGSWASYPAHAMDSRESKAFGVLMQVAGIVLVLVVIAVAKRRQVSRCFCSQRSSASLPARARRRPTCDSAECGGGGRMLGASESTRSARGDWRDNEWRRRWGQAK